MEHKSQQLTVSQQKLIEKTEKVGRLTSIAFAKSVLDQVKIKEIKESELGPSIGYIFQNISLLLGIKSEITDINKKDIKNMILKFYGNLSLEEIVYAFELERYNQLDPKTEHFQLFNAEYVSTVLKKYKNWLAQVRFDNNLPISKPKEQINSTSQKEKDAIMRNGCIRCYNEFKELGFIKEGNTHIYDHLIDDLKIHTFTVDEKKAAVKIAKKKIKEDAKTLGRIKAKYVISSLDNKNNKAVTNRAKRLLLESLFMSLGNKGLEGKI